MSDFNAILAGLSKTADSISEIYFRPPGTFTNAIIRNPPILSLIRDSDASEDKIISNSKNATSLLMKNDFNKMDVFGMDDDDNKVDIRALYSRLEQLMSIYPISGAMEKASSYKYEYERLINSISRLECELEEQKKNVAQLSNSLNIYEKNYSKTKSAASEKTTAQKIEEIQREISRLKLER